MEKSVQKLLDGNRAWTQECLATNPDYFRSLAHSQSPEYLWIGCSDSRVSADRITGTQPGGIFVHRNIANIVVPEDRNLLAVLQFAVEALQVKHIIVCGHYGCGGVQAALGAPVSGPLDDWLSHIREVYRQHQSELAAINDTQEKGYRLAELNVVAQVQRLRGISILQESWKSRGAPYLHGWIYSIADGVLRDLGVTVRGGPKR